MRRSADFERALRAAPKARSAHFSLHHVKAESKVTAYAPTDPELSTGLAAAGMHPVDDSPAELPPRSPDPGQALGLVVPKRHARRAVTRSLLKRQMREAARRHLAGLEAGIWVLRLKASFDVPGQPRRSAADTGLRCDSRAELDRLFARLGAPVDRSAPGHRRG